MCLKLSNNKCIQLCTNWTILFVDSVLYMYLCSMILLLVIYLRMYCDDGVMIYTSTYNKITTATTSNTEFTKDKQHVFVCFHWRQLITYKLRKKNGKRQIINTSKWRCAGQTTQTIPYNTITNKFEIEWSKQLKDIDE